MIRKQLISSLFFLTILVVNVQQGVSLKCYECLSGDESDDCWTKPDNLPNTECGQQTNTTTESTTTLEPNTTTAESTTTLKPNTTITESTTTLEPNTTITESTTTLEPNSTTAESTTTLEPNTTTTLESNTTTTLEPNTTTTLESNTTITLESNTTITLEPNTTTTLESNTTTTLEPNTTALEPEKEPTLSPEDAKIYADLKRKNPDVFKERSKRDTTEWECAKIMIKNEKVKLMERKCVKKSDQVCKNGENNSGKECAVCDTDLCNSASNIKLQLIPAFLSVFLALFLSSQ